MAGSVLCALVAFVFSQITILSLASPTVQTATRINTPPGKTPHDVVQAVRRGLGAAANSSEGLHWKSQKTLDRSWDGAVLLQLGRSQSIDVSRHSGVGFSEGIEIVCSKCYVTGVATAELSAERFNTSLIVYQTIDELGENFENFTLEVFDYIGVVVEDVADEVGDTIKDFFEGDPHGLDPIAMPTLDYSFDMDIPALPEVKLSFGFEALELYMMLDTTLSLGSTYTYSLFKSNSPVGIAIPDLEFGLVFEIDLILTAEAEIDISSGFHIKLDDGLSFDIALFSNEASGINFNGGQFEFLPVTVQTANGIFTAVLRLGAHAGIALNADFGMLSDISDFSMGAGIEVGVFANVAEFTTNVTYQADDDAECALAIEQTYQFALGAAAGATVHFDSYTWGPAPNTSVPIFYTTLASGCAMQATPTVTAASNATITAAPMAHRRQDMSTATITREVTYTGVNCLSSGLVNCPASLQNTSQSIATTVFTTILPSDVDEDDISLPATVTDAVATTIPFGANASRLPISSGSPVSYVPPPPATSTAHVIGGIADDIEDAFNKPLVIGLTAGLGGSFLLAVAALSFFVWRKRQTYSAVSLVETRDMFTARCKSDVPNVHITEIQPLAFSRRY